MDRIGGGRAWLVWALATAFVVWVFAIQSGYAIVSPSIERDASLTVGQIGLAASIYTWVFAVMQFFSGPLLDRFGPRPLSAIAVGLVTIGAFLYAMTSSFATLALAQVVLALGASFGFVGAGFIGGKWFPTARFGLMFGLVQTCASVGTALCQQTMSILLGSTSWQALLAGLGVIGVFLTLAFVLFVRNPRLPDVFFPVPQPPLLPTIARDLRACVSNSQVVISAFVAAASFATLLAFGVLWGARVVEARGLPVSQAATCSALLWLGLALGAPLINILSDRLNNRRTPAVAALLLQAVLVCVLLYAPFSGFFFEAGLMFVLGVCSSGHMLGFTVAGESVTPNLIGTSASFVNGVCFIVGGIFVAVPSDFIPSQATLANYQSVLWIMPAMLMVAAFAGLGIRSRR